MGHVRYFKPRQDLPYSSGLLPQKIVGGHLYTLRPEGYMSCWKLTSVVTLYTQELLEKNFIEVQSERELVQ